MAGAQHGSVTGMDERTLGRIDLILFDADYRDAHVAVDDSWRVAVLAADPRLRADHERARIAAVHAANERRDPGAARVPMTTTGHRASLGAAFVCGIVAVALVATSRSSPLPLSAGMLPAGLLAVAAVGLLWWLEPRRASGALWGSRVPAAIHLGFGLLWLLAAGGVVLFRWGELDPYRVLPVTTGLALLVCAGVAALFLWHRAQRADRSGRQTGVARLTGDLLDPRDAAEVLDALDRWWQGAGPGAMRRDAARVRAVRIETLARLRLGTIISPRDERTAALAPAPDVWRERRR